MTTPLKKSVLCDLVTRHNNFNFDSVIKSNVEDTDYINWNDNYLFSVYSDTEQEYQSLRNRCAIFDASPMRKYRLRGSDSGGFLDRLLTNPMSSLPVMKAGYGLICDEQGYVIDDGIIYKFSEDDYLLLVADMNHDEHFAKHNDFNDISITDETELLAGIAIQGPKSCAVLNQLGFVGVENLKPFELATYDLNGHPIIVGRLGFSGDLGYEFWFSPAAIDDVSHALTQAEINLGFNIPGYGLAALQICRIEAGMIVPGWDTSGEFTDLNLERTPYEMTLGWNVKLNREENFVGKQALTEQKESGPRFKMLGVTIAEKCNLIERQALFASVNGQEVEIGSLPSLSWHASKECWLAYGSIKTEFVHIEDCYIKDNGRSVDAKPSSLPFIQLEHRNITPAQL